MGPPALPKLQRRRDSRIRLKLNMKNPKLLIVSGFHGDERGVISSVKRAVKKYHDALLPFFFIPEVSPSAIRLGTRFNKNKADLNRSFFDDSSVEEVRLLIKKVLPYKFDVCISFHEDPEYSDFYLYDAYGENLEGSHLLQNLRSRIKSLNVGLLNGIDDPQDPTLGITFHEGYHYFPPVHENKDGFFSDWAFTKGVIKRYLNPEIPGKLDQIRKDKLVEILFNQLLVIPPSAQTQEYGPSSKL